MSYLREKKYHIKHTKAFSEAVFTLYRIAFGPACNSYRMGLLYTRKKTDFGAISLSIKTDSCSYFMG